MIQTAHSPFGDTRGYPLYLDMGHFSAVSVRETAGQRFLDVILPARGNVPTVAKEGTVGKFAVGGRIVSLATTKAALPVANATRTTVFTQWRLQFPLTRPQALRFVVDDLEAVEVTIGGEQYQLGLKPKQSESFRQAFACLNPTDAGIANND